MTSARVVCLGFVFAITSFGQGSATETSGAPVLTLAPIAPAPTITLNPAGPLTFNYVIGSPAPVVGANGVVAISVTNTPENPSIPLTLTASAAPAGICTVTGSGSVNSGATMMVLLNPANFVAGVNTCNITVASPPGLTAGPATLSITVNAAVCPLASASPNPVVENLAASSPPQSVHVTLTNFCLASSFLAHAVALTPLPNPTWLSATGGAVTNGTGDSTVTFDDTNLPAGQYVGSVAYSSPGDSTIYLTNVPVIMNVGAIQASQSSITFNHTLNFTPPNLQSTTVSLTSPAIPIPAGLPFTVNVSTATGGNWLSATASNNNMTPSVLAVSYMPPAACTPVAGTPCHFTGSITITTTGSSAAPIVIPVTLDVGGVSLAATIGGAGATSVVFPTTVIGNAVAPITVNAVGVGLPAGLTMPFNLTFTSTPAWLQVTPTSGNTGAAGSPITVSVNMAAFGPNPVPGTYDGAIVVTSPNASNTLTLGVVLTLVQPTYTVSPAGIISFSASPCGGVLTPASTTLDFRSNGATFPITIANTLPGWLSATVNGQTATLTPSLTGISSGTYTTTVLFFIAGPSNSTIPVTVTLTIIAGPCCSLVLTQTSASLTYTGTTTNGFIPLNSSTFSITPVAGVPGSNGCAGAAWTVTSSTSGTAANWLAVTGGATGSGPNPATVTFTAMGNPHSQSRSASLTVNGSNAIGGVFTVTEAADTASTFNQRAIRAFYQQLLGRDPDQGGFNFWNSQCVNSASCLGQLVDQFLTSQESQGANFAAMTAYQAATGAPPSFGQWLTAVNQIRTGAQTAAGLVATLSPNLTVDVLYQDLLGRAATTAELGQSVAAAFNAIVASPEFRNTTGGIDHSNGLFIRLLYYIILGRDPDPGGLQFWTNQANGIGPGVFFNGPAAARVAIIGPGQPNVGFIGSPEFQSLFQ